MVYDPASIAAYWGKRPRAVATRIIQLTSVAGGFLSRLAWDVINKKVKEASHPSFYLHCFYQLLDNFSFVAKFHRTLKV